MSSPSPLQGRIIRAALIIFPFGTVVLGIASFGIWWVKKVKVEERSFRHALALRRDLSEAGLQRHETILKEVLAQPEPKQRFAAVPAYLESSLGPENMGYKVRRDHVLRGTVEYSNLDVELSGKQRLREVSLLLVPYDQAAETQARALAMLLSLAHALTGEPGSRTLRFAALPLADDPTALERWISSSRGREERFMQVWVLGSLPQAQVQALHQAFRTQETGTLLQVLPVPAEASAVLPATQALKAELLRSRE